MRLVAAVDDGDVVAVDPRRPPLPCRVTTKQQNH
jgi:hypothetical protein